MRTNIIRTRLTYVLLVVFLLLCIGFIVPMNYVPQTSAEALSLAPTSASDSMNMSNKFGLYYYLNISEQMVAENISEKLVAEENANPNKITIKKTTSTCVSMYDVPNINQSELNNAYSSTHDRTITGTCTLVAIEEIIEATQNLSDEPNLFPGTRDERFEALVDAFELYGGNDYTATSQDELDLIISSSGTIVRTTPLNLQRVVAPVFYSHHLAFNFWGDGYHLDGVEKVNYYSSIESLEASNVLPLSLINIYNYNRSSAHTLAIAGAYNVNVSYKFNTTSGWNWLFPKSGNKDYTILVVCNGWHTCDDGNFYINGNYQYLVLDYDMPFTIIGWNWYDLIPDIDF